MAQPALHATGPRQPPLCPRRLRRQGADADELQADFVLSADGAMWRPDEPSITVANRGLAALEFTLTGAAKDLHSGRHGGGVANPLQALARLVASLHDDKG